MKIIYLVPRFYPSVGGGETYVYEIASRMVKKGHDVTVYTTNITNSSALTDVKEHNGIKIKRFSVLGPKNFYHFCPDMEKELNMEKGDIMHGMGFTFFGNDLAARICKKNKMPFVHNPFYHPISTSQGKRKIFRIFYDYFFGRKKLKQASKIVAVTNQEINYLSKYTKRRKFKKIVLGIDFKNLESKEYLKEFKKKYGIKNIDTILLSLGRIKKNKGNQFIIKALKEIKKKEKHIKLLIIGPDDGYLDELKKLSNAYSLNENIIFTGKIQYKFLAAAYNSADIFVFPSEYESFGIVAAEALSCAVPVVGTDIGGTREIVINKKYGLLSKYGDVKSMTKNLLRLIRDKKLRKKMGTEGKKYVYKIFNWDNITNQLEGLYKDITKRK